MAITSPALILLPVDGSASSVRAANHCATLAKAFGATVILLNVQPEIEDWQTHGVGRQAAEDHLAALAKTVTAEPAKALADAGIAFESIVESGDAPEVIARVAEERKCTSVVMGTRGQSKLKGLLMGSVGMKVISLVQVPVTLVH
ncbi:MAG: universal stress protein [Betaproteobacteria bacterium]|nr:universal stress protein [Betaproteobacteria bacterium]